MPFRNLEASTIERQKLLSSVLTVEQSPGDPQAQAGLVLEVEGWIPLAEQASRSVKGQYYPSQSILIAGTLILESYSTNNRNHTRLFS